MAGSAALQETDVHPIILKTVACLILFSAAALADDAELTRLRAENAALKARVAELEKQLGESTAAAAQLRAEKDKYEARSQAYYVIRQDSGAGSSVVTSRVSDLNITHGAAPRYQWLSLAADLPAGKPAAVTLTVQTAFTGTMYRSVKTVDLIVDGQSVSLPVAAYESKFRTMPAGRETLRKDDEKLTAALTADQLRLIASAREVTGQVDSVRFTLTRDQVQTFFALAKELKLVD